MNNTIQQIIEIEEMAQEVVADVKETKANLEKIIDESVEKKKAEILNKINIEKEARIKANDDDVAKKIIKIKEDTARKISGLDAKYRRNKQMWEDNLFDEIINVRT
ncbi:MAG: hypothetical protein J1F64_04930 [Oscillospiraceae bacterium]|nr:hypothetical protein [Oscillospiraceae bacterium]